MLAKRIIPCLDIKDGRTVKGVNFVDLRDAGDPLVLAAKYAEGGADELVFLDISATHEQRKTLVELVSQIGRVIDIPFTVGGGIRDVGIVEELLAAGADKVSVNSAAIEHPRLVSEIAARYGSQCMVVAIDARSVAGRWTVHTHGGRRDTGVELFDWAARVVDLGAGEILLTSMDADGTQSGFEMGVLQRLTDAVSIPVIASGGAGSITDFIDLFTHTRATGALAASIFHYGTVEIGDLKRELSAFDIPVRPHNLERAK